MLLVGGIVSLRLAEVDDAQFILDLRLDDELSRYIHKTDCSVEKQRGWLVRYKEREQRKEEYYFIIQTIAGQPCGTLRVYEIGQDVCTWGSWILRPGRPESASIESAALSYDFAFNVLDKHRIKLDVMKANSRAIHLYEKFGFEHTASTDQFEHYELGRSTYRELRRDIVKAYGLSTLEAKL